MSQGGRIRFTSLVNQLQIHSCVLDLGVPSAQTVGQKSALVRLGACPRPVVSGNIARRTEVISLFVDLFMYTGTIYMSIIGAQKDSAVNSCSAIGWPSCRGYMTRRKEACSASPVSGIRIVHTANATCRQGAALCVLDSRPLCTSSVLHEQHSTIVEDTRGPPGSRHPCPCP